jgi:hypothetical protein
MSSTTTLQAASVTYDTKRDRLKSFIRRMVEISGMTVTEEEFIENCKIYHGSVEHALELVESAEVQNKAAVEQAFPGGWQSADIQVGVSHVALQRPTHSLTCSDTSANPDPAKRRWSQT